MMAGSLGVKESRLVNNNMQAALRTLSCKYDSNKGGVSSALLVQFLKEVTSEELNLAQRGGTGCQVLPTDMLVNFFQQQVGRGT